MKAIIWGVFMIVALVVWSFVMNAALASAQDTAVVAPVVTAVDHASYLIVPSACHLDAGSVASVHTVLCDGKVECTAKFVAVVCQGVAK